MASTLRQFVVVALALALMAGACSGGEKENPFQPDPLSPDPPKPRYETLPAKHYLANASGNETEMWATLYWVSPERGSKVQIGPSACPNNCFRYSMEVGLDIIPGETNNYVGASFETWFSLDGKEPIGESHDWYRLNGGGVGMGQSQMLGSDIIRMFQAVPKYILVKGQYRRSWTCPCPPGGPPDPVVGSVAFELDYHR